MSHAKNKVEWCLNKSKKELEKEGKHRGLIKTNPDLNKAREYIEKAEHYIKATDFLKKGKIDLKKEVIDKISSLNEDKETTVEIRERFQYGTETEVKDEIYNELFSLARELLSKTKE